MQLVTGLLWKLRDFRSSLAPLPFHFFLNGSALLISFCHRPALATESTSTVDLPVYLYPASLPSHIQSTLTVSWAYRITSKRTSIIDNIHMSRQHPASPKEQLEKIAVELLVQHIAVSIQAYPDSISRTPHLDS